MPDRKTRLRTFWLAAALVLLAWMLTAPTRTKVSDPASSRSERSAACFDLPPSPPMTCLGAAIPVEPVLLDNALRSESEEQDQVDALDEARITFQVPCSFHKVADRRPIAPRPIPSLYPLRC